MTVRDRTKQSETLQAKPVTSKCFGANQMESVPRLHDICI